jgi:transcriptional regulator with XRE-family HTH domain
MPHNRIMSERGDLATLIRAWRDRLRPETVGLPGGPGRRAAGIRREELSMLAGISVDYIVRLEQGRADRPSEQVVAAITRALQLSEDERDQLYIAAGLVPPSPTLVPRHIPPSVQRMLVRMPDIGTAVFAADWTLVTANDAWMGLHGTWTGEPRERNLLWRQFVTGNTRLRRDDAATEHFERAIIADLRIATIRYPADPSLQTLISDLRDRSPRFRAFWAGVEVATHRGERKTIVHPSIGDITLDCDVCTVEGTGLRIVTFTAEPGSDDESRLALARTLGVAVSIA